MTSLTVTDPLALLGTWEMAREIRDHLTGEVRAVTGTMELIAEHPGRIRWSEEGVMAWEGTRLPVYRHLWVDKREGGWFVTFEDGRDFHPWTPGAEVVHPCRADTYVGLIELSPVEPWRWTVQWRVSGPAKDYEISTVLTRARAADWGPRP